MAIKNSVQLYINGRSQTYGLVMPVKIGEFLDEQLDEARVSLRHIKRDNFTPLSCAEMVINSELYWSNLGDGENRTPPPKYFIVADDEATENPPRSGLYDHELYLLEVTKLLERVVVDTLTYTNDLGRNYVKNAPYALPVKL